MTYGRMNAKMARWTKLRSKEEGKGKKLQRIRFKA